jgi:hypothetical protein
MDSQSTKRHRLSMPAPKATACHRSYVINDDAGNESDHASDWIDMNAQHYTDTIFDDIVVRTADLHSKCDPTKPKKNMSYSSSIKALEVTYRGFVHAVLEPESSTGVLPPGESDAAKKGRAEVIGLHLSIRQKLEAASGAETVIQEADPLINKLLRVNLERCTWTYVALVAREIEARALANSRLSVESARETREHLDRFLPR